MIQIHYTKSDRHVRWCSFNGEHRHVDHIIHMTHVQPFGFLCSEAMSVHARLVKQTQVFSRVQHGLHPLYVDVESITSDHHEMLRNDELFQWCIRGLYCLDISERDHLIMLPSQSKQNKMHKRINITCINNVIWYGPSCTWSPSLHRHGAKVHGASILVVIQYYNISPGYTYSTQAIK